MYVHKRVYYEFITANIRPHACTYEYESYGGLWLFLVTWSERDPPTHGSAVCGDYANVERVTDCNRYNECY